MKNQKQKLTGFSLVEMVIAMFIFVILAVGLTKSMIYAQQMAEDNLYEASALTVASSFIEQIKGVSYAELNNPSKSGGKEYIEVVIGNGIEKKLFLDEANEFEIPIVTEQSGETNKTLPLKVNPAIIPMDLGSGYWIEIKYEFEHPETKRLRTRFLRNGRSAVPHN